MAMKDARLYKNHQIESRFGKTGPLNVFEKRDIIEHLVNELISLFWFN